MKRMLLFATLAVAFAAGARGATAQSPAPGAAPSPAAIVHIKNFAYTPGTVTIKTGDVVQFVNDDPVAHTVTAADAAGFDSGNMDEHAVWRHAFTKAGTYPYLCTYHTYMKGTVVVKDGS
jgi:plastocyanin